MERQESNWGPAWLIVWGLMFHACHFDTLVAPSADDNRRRDEIENRTERAVTALEELATDHRTCAQKESQ